MEQKIDFVILWVDGSDEAWRKEKERYQPPKGTDSKQIRYRDWDILRFWFRGIEAYAPWVNRIHFVTCGHLPEWLDTSHPKLNIVKHSDYMPSEYLPTFSSHPIELNLARISGLEEQFVYFNDDMFLIRDVTPGDFFQNGLPRDCCIESAVMQDNYEDPFAHILLNDCALLNQHFQKKEVIKKQWKKWFSPVYGTAMLRNLLMMPYRQFTSFKFFHIPSPFLKSTLEEVWACEPKTLDEVCRNKFRGIMDVNQYLFKYWQFAQGRFIPQSAHTGKFFIPGRDDAAMYQAIEKQTYKMICINDDGQEEDFELLKAQVTASFTKILPERSGFERG
ncbi:MAG: Stealth CR1 domain-containing protein [Lachnospiraceae bacterium]